MLEKVRNEGLFETLRQVRAKLDENPMSMGYSSAGVVLACGHGVSGYKVGDRVASNGPHAGVVTVPVNLCARIPEGVTYDNASFAVVGSIAMQGVRLSKVSLGESALVIGLGLVGQLAVMILKAAGVRVIAATDLDPEKCDLAIKLERRCCFSYAFRTTNSRHSQMVMVSMVLVTAATESKCSDRTCGCSYSSTRACCPSWCYSNRYSTCSIYEKEAEFTVSCSYGPVRYDPEYEIEGRDYPLRICSLDRTAKHSSRS